MPFILLNSLSLVEFAEEEPLPTAMLLAVVSGDPHLPLVCCQFASVDSPLPHSLPAAAVAAALDQTEMTNMH